MATRPALTFRQQLILAAGATVGLSLLYLVAFRSAGGGTMLGDVRAALCNAVPATCLGWLIAARLAPLLWPLARWPVLAGVATTLILYTLTSYIATLVLLAVTGGDGRSGGLWISYFTGPAFVWQCFQGLAYGLVALLVGWLVRALQQPDRDPASEPLGRLLIRTDAGIVPVEGQAIIRIAGADDYCELVLPSIRHLARMTMAECETLLANEPIIRVHRSHIVNIRHMVSAEPTGDGRLQVLLSNGDMVITSRGGAKLLREQSG